MSIISYIAIGAFLLGILALIYQVLRKESKNVFLFLFIGLAGLVLFVVSNMFAQKEVAEAPEIVADAAEAQGAEKPEVAEAQEADVVEDVEAQEAAPEAETDVADAEAEADAEVADAIAEEEPAAVEEELTDAEKELAEALAILAQAEEELARANAQLLEVTDEAAPEEAKEEEVAPNEEPLPAPSADDPTASAGNNVRNAKVDAVIAFNGSGSKAVKGAKIAKYTWDFGDGKTAEGQKVNHSFEKPGEYEVTLTVTDSEGRQGTDSLMADVCRPAAKVRDAVKPRVPDAKGATTSLAEITGTFEKTYTCSRAYVEVTGNVVSTEGCDCRINVKLTGPGCFTTEEKGLDNGGEGKLSLRATCMGEVGQYNWTLSRTVKGNSCHCDFTNVKLADIFES